MNSPEQAPESRPAKERRVGTFTFGAVLVILLGLWFIRGPRAKSPIDDDIPPFTPPAPDAAPASGAGTDPVDEAAAEIHAAVDPSAEKEAHRDEQP